VAPLGRSGHPSDAALIGVSGAFAATATILGSPLVAAMFMIEAIGFGGAQLFATMLPGLLAAGVGSVMFTGLGEWTGFEVQTLGLPPLPAFPRPDIGDVPVGRPARRAQRPGRLRHPGDSPPRPADRARAADGNGAGRRCRRRRGGGARTR
jgi:hypothetical protein